MEDRKRVEISICMGSSCFARGNGRALEPLREYLRARHLEGSVAVRGVLCCGGCSRGPHLVIDGQAHERVEPGALVPLLDHHLGRRREEPG